MVLSYIKFIKNVDILIKVSIIMICSNVQTLLKIMRFY